MEQNYNAQNVARTGTKNAMGISSVACDIGKYSCSKNRKSDVTQHPAYNKRDGGSG